MRPVSPSTHDDNEERDAPTLGLLTKTLNSSPVARWILPVSSIQPRLQALAFVGEDSVRICEVTDGGHLRHLTTRNDFDCKILKAATIRREQWHDDSSANGVKREYDLYRPTSNSQYHDLVLTLSNGELVTLSINDHRAQSNIVTSRTALPTSADPLQRYGKLLAVEPHGRAIAVAAQEGGLLLLDSLHGQSDPTGTADGPTPNLEQKRPLLQIEGLVHRMSFLEPPINDPDHIVLLLVKCMDRKVFVQRVEWLASEGSPAAHVHNAQRITTGK